MTREPLYRWLVPRVVAPIGARLGRTAWTTARDLQTLQWRRPEELENRAVARLHALLEHAAHHVPHYRALLAGIDPRTIKSVADLARVPLTAKPELRAGFPARTVADNIPEARRQRMMTSGSTGVPLALFWDRSMLPLLGGTYFFLLGWAGTAVWHPRLVLASPTYFYESVEAPRPLRRWLDRLVIGRESVSLPADEVTTAGFRSLVARLTRRGPYFIWGYPGSLANLAAALAREAIPLASTPRVVVTVAETLTAANVENLRRIFGCPVVNYYSSWEVPQIAQTCPDNPDMLHVNGERVVLRVVREDGIDAPPGEAGRVVLTDLANYAMPFINYLTGDRAVAGGPCACGRGWPTLARLEGRESEFIRTLAGREIHGGPLGQLLTFVIGIIPYVWEYQAVQTARDRVRLLVVPTSRYTSQYGETLRRRVEEFLGPGMTVTLEPVDAIPLEPSGKRLIIKALPEA